MAKVIPQYIRTVAFHAENEDKHTYAFHLRQCADALEQAQAEKEEINKAYHDMNYQVHKLTYEKMELQAEIERLRNHLEHIQALTRKALEGSE